MWWTIAIAVAGFVAYAVWTAKRLHRLHLRCDRTRAVLAATLDERVQAAFAAAGKDDTMTVAAERAQHAGVAGGSAQSELTVAIAARVDADGPGSADLLTAHTHAAMARRFYNDAVRDTRHLRANPVVRLCHLAGTAALPAPCIFDDDLPLARAHVVA
jgi:hypothetical protein